MSEHCNHQRNCDGYEFLPPKCGREEGHDGPHVSTSNMWEIPHPGRPTFDREVWE